MDMRRVECGGLDHVLSYEVLFRRDDEGLNSREEENGIELN